MSANPQDDERHFYVYVLMRPNGDPFYVGKGTKDRMHIHEREARKGCACHKCKVIRKIWNSGQQVRKGIVYTTRSEADAYREELRLIQSIGLKNLTNIDSRDPKWLGEVVPRDVADMNIAELYNYFRRQGTKGWEDRYRNELGQRLEYLKHLYRYRGVSNLTEEERNENAAQIEELKIAINPRYAQQYEMFKNG